MHSLATTIVLVLNASSTLFMVGLIWFVQIVHYPLFGRVGSEQFSVYHRQHQKRTSYVVAAPMLVEAITSVLLIWNPPIQNGTALLLIGVGLVFIIWASTLFLQIPSHTDLEGGYQKRAHHTLVWSNWARTSAWTLRGVLVCWLIAMAMMQGFE